MGQFLADYGLFLLKVITIVAAIAAVMLIAAMAGATAIACVLFVVGGLPAAMVFLGALDIRLFFFD